MQPDLILLLAGALGVGFVLGYFVRAMMSRRRRRQGVRRPRAETPLRLERPGSNQRDERSAYGFTASL